jgi:hypothetical protein
MHHGVTVRRSDGQAIWITEVPDHSLDILKRTRIRAFANIGNDIVAGRPQTANDTTPDEAGCPCNQTAHVGLVTGSVAPTKGSAQYLWSTLYSASTSTRSTL